MKPRDPVPSSNARERFDPVDGMIGTHLPVVGGVGSSGVARASRPWVRVRLSDMGKMPMPLAPPATARCARMIVVETKKIETRRMGSYSFPA